MTARDMKLACYAGGTLDECVEVRLEHHERGRLRQRGIFCNRPLQKKLRGGVIYRGQLNTIRRRYRRPSGGVTLVAATEGTYSAGWELFVRRFNDDVVFGLHVLASHFKFGDCAFDYGCE